VNHCTYHYQSSFAQRSHGRVAFANQSVRRSQQFGGNCDFARRFTGCHSVRSKAPRLLADKSSIQPFVNGRSVASTFQTSRFGLVPLHATARLLFSDQQLNDDAWLIQESAFSMPARKSKQPLRRFQLFRITRRVHRFFSDSLQMRRCFRLDRL
jgi:hypothetical protein